MPPVIDGVHGGERIAKLWGLKFRGLFTSPDHDTLSHLAETLSLFKVDPDELQSLNITPEVVRNALSKVKRGKSDGDTLSSDICA